MDSRIVAPPCVVEFHNAIVACATARGVEQPAVKNIDGAVWMLDDMPEGERQQAIDLVLHGVYGRLRELRLLWERNVLPNVTAPAEAYTFAFRAWRHMGTLKDAYYTDFSGKDNDLLAHYGKGSLPWRAYWVGQNAIDALVLGMLHTVFDVLPEVPAWLSGYVGEDELKQFTEAA